MRSIPFIMIFKPTTMKTKLSSVVIIYEIVSLALCQSPFSNSIEWVQGSAEVAIQMQLEPAGVEEMMEIFLCRTHKENNTIPGKLVTNNGQCRCVSPYRGFELARKTFELLYFHPGTISWRKYTGTTDSNNTVVGGRLDGHIVYICRGRRNKELLTGMLNGITGACDVVKDELTFGLSEMVEVLMRNALGEAMDTHMAGN